MTTTQTNKQVKRNKNIQLAVKVWLKLEEWGNDQEEKSVIKEVRKK